MDRRRFLLTSLAGAFTAPLAAEAQQGGKAPRIAFLTTTSPGGSPTTDAFLHGLRELGYVEGQNMTIEWRWGRGSTERFPAFAAEMVRLNVDIIVAGNDIAGRAAQQATKTIPIVIVLIGDPTRGMGRHPTRRAIPLSVTEDVAAFIRALRVHGRGGCDRAEVG